MAHLTQSCKQQSSIRMRRRIDIAESEKDEHADQRSCDEDCVAAIAHIFGRFLPRLGPFTPLNGPFVLGDSLGAAQRPYMIRFPAGQEIR